MDVNKDLTHKIELLYKSIIEEKINLQEKTKAVFHLLQSKTHLVQAPILQHLEQIQKRINEMDSEDSFSIIVTGTYNAGKSSLINALLQKTERKIGSIPTTDTIATIQWHNLTFYDTPGVDSLDHDIIEEIYKLADQSQLILYVLSAGQGNLDNNQMEFIKSLVSHCPSIFFVINKKDIRED